MDYNFKDVTPEALAPGKDPYRDPIHIDPNVRYAISDIARFIRGKMYGIDVREALAQLADRLDLDIKTIEDIRDKMMAESDGLKKRQILVEELQNALERKFNGLANVVKKSDENNADALVAFAELKRQLDNLILKSGDSNPELINARTTKDGKTYPNLKDRLDDEKQGNLAITDHLSRFSPINRHRPRPMITILDDDGFKDFRRIMVPIAEEYGIPMT